MQAREMKQLMTMACRLTSSQRQTLLASLTSGVAHCEALELVQSRLAQAPSCPKCRGAKVERNGHQGPLQVQLAEVPQGITAKADSISEGQTSGQLTLTADTAMGDAEVLAFVSVTVKIGETFIWCAQCFHLVVLCSIRSLLL